MTTKLIVPTVLATADPSVTDDRAHGMHAGFRWINTSTGDRFTCRSDAAGAAVWDAESSGGGGSIKVEDGSTTVDPCNEIEFTSGATVTDAGGGKAQVAISGGGGSNLIGTACCEISGGTISASRVTGNIASITKLATGKWRVTFSVAEADTDYVPVIFFPDDNTAARFAYGAGTISQFTTASFDFFTYNDGSAPGNPSFIRVAVLRY